VSVEGREPCKILARFFKKYFSLEGMDLVGWEKKGKRKGKETESLLPLEFHLPL
jgi:hypothetical protein